MVDALSFALADPQYLGGDPFYCLGRGDRLDVVPVAETVGRRRQTLVPLQRIPSVTKARLIAQLLANRILSEGNVAGSPQHVGSSEESMQFASSHHKEDAYEQTAAFIPIQVIAVVYKEDRRELKSGEKPNHEVMVLIAGRPTSSILENLPDEIDGVPIRVERSTLVDVSPEKAEASSAESRIYLRDGKIACGSSCATATGYAGTIGAVVKDESDDSLCILSCNHVLASCNCISLGMPIIAPATHDAKPDGQIPLGIARLSKSIELRQGHWTQVTPCEVDAALGRLLDSKYVTSWQGESPGYDTPSRIADPETGMKVKKFGRSTGLTHGVVSGTVEGIWPVPYHAKDFKGRLYFKNHALVIGSRTPFALPGDSGSLVVTEDEKCAVGLLFSANSAGNLAFIIPISRVVKALGVSLVSEH